MLNQSSASPQALLVVPAASDPTDQSDNVRSMVSFVYVDQDGDASVLPSYHWRFVLSLKSTERPIQCQLPAVIDDPVVAKRMSVPAEFLPRTCKFPPAVPIRRILEVDPA